MNDEPTPGPTRLPTPESSARRPEPTGTGAVLADGREWALADHVPRFGEAWDRIYDDNLVAGRYDVVDVRLAAVALLLENYDLPAPFAAWLVADVPPDALVPAVEAALFGRRDAIRTWSGWAESALRANGIDPAAVPPALLRPVLDQLVGAGRAVAAADFTTAGIAASRRRDLMAGFERAGIRPTPPAGDVGDSPEAES